MRRSIGTLVIMALAACGDPGPTGLVSSSLSPARLPGADYGGVSLSATLTGAAVVPGPGDPNGSGTALFTINVGQGELCYELAVTGISAALTATLNIAPPTGAGPVVVTLVPPDPTVGLSFHCTTISRELALAIIQNPGDYYVAVGTADFWPEALRGQLTAP